MQYLVRLSIRHELVLIIYLLLPLLGQHIVDLILIKVLNQGALVFPPGEFGGEFRDSLSLNVLQDVDVLGETLHRLFIPVILKLAPFPPVGFFLDEAATAVFQDPRHDVLVVRIVELALLNDGIEEMVARCLGRLDFWIGRILTIKLIRLRRGRIHLANEGGLELEILKRLDHTPKEGPNQRGESTD